MVWSLQQLVLANKLPSLCWLHFYVIWAPVCIAMLQALLYTVRQKKLGHFFTVYNFRNIELAQIKDSSF